ncbi:glycerophosphodiester phosphodiesterase [Niallia sp. 03190]|uniref:glycerophosphodiester phosphodiesterase n=1 Tax=Niallia sp. 03190 TaxID=3458061 RepID=UPI0040440789
MSLIFAHRGYSAQFPENTMIAFQQAKEANADGIELDIQMTKDGELVIIHDEKVDRTTSGSGYVKELSFKEIRTLDAAYKYKGKLHKVQIPALEEFLEWIKPTALTCNIEFKNNLFVYAGMEDKAIELVRRYGLSERVIFSSFNHYSIVNSYRLAPEIETAPLFSDGIYQPWIYAEAIKATGIHPNHRLLNSQIIKASENYGIKVRAYTVNNEKRLQYLLESGISAVITDDPVLAKNVMNRIKNT